MGDVKSYVMNKLGRRDFIEKSVLAGAAGIFFLLDLQSLSPFLLSE
ncbi:MAG TPA: hypothetical protein PLX87_01665 [Bacteroidales bacterium]|nr:hypothetical protein [Bacteroidales bacterium]HPP91971.1 hypothetical protein [Bacteroidales bacterium]